MGNAGDQIWNQVYAKACFLNSGLSPLKVRCFLPILSYRESQLGLKPAAAEAEGMALHASWLHQFKSLVAFYLSKHI